MKKYVKLLIITVLSFTISLTWVSAKKLNFKELQKEIEGINEDATEARIIGKYIFTDANPLTDQDIMAGALTIPDIDDTDYSEELYDKLTIQRMIPKQENMENGRLLAT